MEPGDDATEKINKLEVELDGVKDKLKKTAAQNIQAQSKAKKKTEECEKLQKEKSELKEKLQKQAAQNVRLKSKVHTLEQAQITAAVAGAGATPASFSMGNEELAMELEKAKVTIENLDRECRFLTGKVQEAGKMGQTLLDANVELQKKLDALSQEKSNTSAVKNNASESIRTLEEMVRALEQENEDLRSNGVTKMVSKRPQLERGITDALQQNDELCATLSRMENENVQLKIQIEKLESSVPDRDDDRMASKVTDSVGPKVSAIKTAFQGAMGKVKQDRLHRLLEEEEERSRDLQIELQNMKKDKGDKDMEVMKMRTAFHDLETYARQQEAEARAAQISAQNLQLRLDGLEQTMKKMGANGETDDHEERMKQIKMAGDIAGTMLQDLKDGLDDSLIDDLNFLTADSSDDDPASEDDEDYEKSLAALEEQRAKEGANAGSSSKGPARLLAPGAAPGGGEVVATVSAPGAAAPAPAPKKLKQGKSIALTKTEKEVVKMTLNDTHKKLLQAMRLVELLKNANDKLQGELDFIEQRAVKKIKCLHNTTVGIVVVVSTLFVCGFFFFVIEKVNCPSEKHH